MKVGLSSRPGDNSSSKNVIIGLEKHRQRFLLPSFPSSCSGVRDIISSPSSKSIIPAPPLVWDTSPEGEGAATAL